MINFVSYGNGDFMIMFRAEPKKLTDRLNKPDRAFHQRKTTIPLCTLKFLPDQKPKYARITPYGGQQEF